MAAYRIDTVIDAEGMVAVRAYAGNEQTPFANSGGVFHSEKEANEAIEGMFAQAWPAKDPFAVDASIGV